MASIVPLFLLFAGFFPPAAGFEFCTTAMNNFGFCKRWDEFCCGNCEESYCCSDPEKRLTKEAQDDCSAKHRENWNKARRRGESVSIAITASVLGVVIFIVVFVICWVCPCCFLHRRFRTPRPVMVTTTTVMTHYLPQLAVQGGRYVPYQPSPNNTPYLVQPPPIGSSTDQPFQNSGVKLEYDGDQATPSPLPTDYTSRQPAYNPAYVGLMVTTVATPVQTGY